MTFGEGASRLCSAASMLLGWRPDEFWNATPAELGLALQVPTQIEGPDRAAIDALLERFPDQSRTK